MKYIGIIILASILIFSCQSDDKNGMTERNLLEYGIPLTIMAPDSVDITKTNYGVSKEVTIQSENSNDYNVQIYLAEATTSDEGKVKAQQLEMLQQMPIFSKVVLDEPNGFIYETVTDSTYHSFGFRRVLIQGTREYIFQTGIGTFTQKQAEDMYHATKPVDLRKK